MKGIASIIFFGWIAASMAGAETRVVIAQGLGTDQVQRDRYESTGRELEAVWKGLGAGVVRLVSDLNQVNKKEMILAEKKMILAEWKKALDASGPEDQAVFVYVGYARWDDNQFWFNLPGPDATSAELAKPMGGTKAGCVTVILGCPQAGRGLKAFSGPRSIVMAATDEAGERQDPVFVNVLASVLKADGLDSWRSAFERAVKGVAQWFTDEGLIQTEHAMLDDNGDGKGSEPPFEGASDGKFSEEWGARGRLVTSLEGEEK